MMLPVVLVVCFCLLFDFTFVRNLYSYILMFLILFDFVYIYLSNFFLMICSIFFSFLFDVVQSILNEIKRFLMIIIVRS